MVIAGLSQLSVRGGRGGGGGVDSDEVGDGTRGEERPLQGG